MVWDYLVYGMGLDNIGVIWCMVWDNLVYGIGLVYVFVWFDMVKKVGV